MKQTLINVLEFLLFQVKEDKCTAEEIRSIHDTVISNLQVDATIPDIAKFYGKTENSVRTTISRRPSKPKRRVFYNMAWFDSIKPTSWKA